MKRSNFFFLGELLFRGPGFLGTDTTNLHPLVISSCREDLLVRVESTSVDDHFMLVLNEADTLCGLQVPDLDAI